MKNYWHMYKLWQTAHTCGNCDKTALTYGNVDKTAYTFRNCDKTAHTCGNCDKTAPTWGNFDKTDQNMWNLWQIACRGEYCYKTAHTIVAQYTICDKHTENLYNEPELFFWSIQYCLFVF